MLSQLLDSITSLVEQIVSKFGSPGITLIAFAENLFPPTPSEILYPLAGKMAHDGKISLIAVIIAGTFGSLMGSLIYYSLGYRLGEARARDVITRLGTIHLRNMKITIISVDDYNRGLELFHSFGGFIVFIARLMPLIHGVVSIPAGVVRMNLLLFVFYTMIGSALWIAPLAGFGYWLGNNWRAVLDWVDFYENIILGLMILGVIYYIYRRIRHRSVNDSGEHIKSYPASD